MIPPQDAAGSKGTEVAVAEKMRVHILAKELNVTSKAILLKCTAEGLPVKNHMTALGPGLEATIREWFTEGRHVTAVETAERVDLKKARAPRRKKKAAATAEAEAVAVAEAEAPAEEVKLKEAAAVEAPAPEAEAAEMLPEVQVEPPAVLVPEPAEEVPVAPATPPEAAPVPEVAKPAEGEPIPERMVAEAEAPAEVAAVPPPDRKSTRLNSSH